MNYIRSTVQLSTRMRLLQGPPGGHSAGLGAGAARARSRAGRVPLAVRVCPTPPTRANVALVLLCLVRLRVPRQVVY